VLRSDQTGTYQAIVNDVYYSNRITPDFTTTRSVSAPQLEFDGYNKLTIKTQHSNTEIDDEINFDTAQGGDWIDAYTKRYIYLSTDSSGDYIYWLWDTYTGDSSSAYTWKGVSGRRFSSTFQIKYSPSTREWLDEGSSKPNIFTKETINGVKYIALYDSSTLIAKFVNPYELLVGKPPTSTTLGLPDGTTRDLTTQSNVYIYETGTYTANVQTSDTFAYLSNVVTGPFTHVGILNAPIALPDTMTQNTAWSRPSNIYYAFLRKINTPTAVTYKAVHFWNGSAYVTPNSDYSNFQYSSTDGDIQFYKSGNDTKLNINPTGSGIDSSGEPSKFKINNTGSFETDAIVTASDVIHLYNASDAWLMAFNMHTV